MKAIIKNKLKFTDWFTLLVSIIYIVMPLDFAPDTLPFLGWIDDLLALFIAITTLVNSQVSETHRTLSLILKTFRIICVSLFALLGLLIILFGTLVYQYFIR